MSKNNTFPSRFDLTVNFNKNSINKFAYLIINKLQHLRYNLNIMLIYSGFKLHRNNLLAMKFFLNIDQKYDTSKS